MHDAKELNASEVIIWGGEPAARTKLGWKPHYNLENLTKERMESDLAWKGF